MAFQLFSYETLLHAMAGVTGSVVGMAAFYPLDTIRSRLQVEDSPKLHGSSWELVLRLANDEGIESLYKGLYPVLQSLSVSNFVYFYSFHGMRSALTGKPSALQDLMIGIVAGSLNVIITSPLWVVNTRMKLANNNYTSISEGLMDISKKEGVRSLWSGILPSLLLVSNPAIQFMVYEAIKRYSIKNHSFDTSIAFLTGAAAKAVATTVTYPLQLIQSRLRAGTSIRPLLREIKSKPSNLFRGLEAKLLQTIMTAALMFTVYEKLVRFVLSILRVRMSKSH